VGGLVWFVNEWLKSQSFADDELTSLHSGRTTA
jgi:hypothetical protein